MTALIKSFLLSLMTVTLIQACSIATRAACKEPAYIADLLNEGLNSLVGFDQSRYNVESCGNDSCKYPPKPECPKKPSSREDDDVSKRSTCPWNYYVHIKENRIPSEIGMALCMCDNTCLDSNGRNQCEYVFEEVIVWQKQEHCKDGFHDWKPETFKKSVACVCALPRETEVSNESGDSE